MKTWKQRAFSPCAFAVIVAIIAFGFAFTGCKTDDGDGGGTVRTGPVDVKTVTLSHVELPLEVGDKVTLTADIMPKRATDKSLTWSTSDGTVATVANGKVTAVGEGTARIIVTTQNGKQAVCEVTVFPPPPPPVPVESIALLSAKTLSLTAGGAATHLTFKIEPEDATDQRVHWTSSAPAVATVVDGTVTGVYEGTATITVKTNDGDFEDTCVVTVTMPVIPGFAWIKPGTFTMGSPVSEPGHFWDPDEPSDEVQHQVTITQGFYMGESQVSQLEFETVIGRNPSYFAYATRTGAAEQERYKDAPVETVTWYDAIEYCIELSKLKGLTPAYTMTVQNRQASGTIIIATVTANWNANGYRLPTEAEWEYACRAGSATYQRYNTGDTITSGAPGVGQANFAATVAGPTYPGKEYAPPNAWGLYAMHGNVAEFCWDWWANYTAAAVSDPRGPASGVQKIQRGGNFYSSTSTGVRSASRDVMEPGYYVSGGNNYISSNRLIGFRVVLPYSAPAAGSSYLPSQSFQDGTNQTLPSTVERYVSFEGNLDSILPSIKRIPKR
jgi:formylglycine-generating enzyme required for sulfatase activity